MSLKTLVYFDGTNVNVLKCQKKGKLIWLLEMSTFSNDELEDYLKKEKSKHLHLILPSTESYQDIIQVPPVKRNMLNSIIEAELKKKFPDLKDPQYFFEPLDEKVIEGKRLLEVFVFAVRGDSFEHFVNRFHQQGKYISAVYPISLIPIALLREYSLTSEEPIMGLFEYGENKVMIVMKKGKVYFIRDTKSYEKGIHDMDLQSISMTINFCRQSLRLIPVQLLLFGTCCEVLETSIDFPLPALCVNKSSVIGGSQDIPINDYLAPLSLLRDPIFMKVINFLPKIHRDQYRQVSIYNYLILLTYLLIAVSVTFGSYKAVEYFTKSAEIQTLRAHIESSPPLISEFKQKYEKFNEIRRFIDFAKQRETQVDIAKLLILLSKTNILHSDAVNLSNIDIRNNANLTSLNIEGNISAKGYAQTYKVYEDLLQVLGVDKHLELKSSKLDIQTAKFRLEFQYRLDLPVSQ